MSVVSFDALVKLPADKLVEIAAKSGVQFHHRKKPETIRAEAAADPAAFAKLIMEAVAPVNQNGNQADVGNERVNNIIKRAALDAMNTKESIEEAIAHVKKRVPEFQAHYGDDNTWHFKCKGAEDSGNIAIPMRVIVTKAEMVSRGRIALRSLNREFGDITTPANSLYTNTVVTF